MPEFFHHGARLCMHVFVCSYAFLGTSPGGIAARVISIVAAEIKGGWWRWRAWVQNWTGGLKRALGTLAIVWAVVIAGCFVNTLYHDHRNLAGRLSAVVNEKNDLKVRLTERETITLKG